MLFLSGVQHYKFCPRQWALIHIDIQWTDNRLTLEGKYIHQNVDNPKYRHRAGERPALRSVPVASKELGLTGICDLIELLESNSKEAITVDKYDGRWTPFPVEYKHGKRKPDSCDILQLCAQAMCIEEKYAITISQGAIFYASEHHRMDVQFSDILRQEVKDVVRRMHSLFDSGTIPEPNFSPKCRNCSIINICNPTINTGKGLDNYIQLLESV